MPPTSQMTKGGTPKLSELAKHLRFLRISCRLVGLLFGRRVSRSLVRSLIRGRTVRVG